MIVDMEVLVFESREGARVSFHSRQVDATGCLESYAVDVAAEGLSATAWVANPGWSHPPSQLFDELASNWAGWKRAQRWHSAEGELQITATMDATGHVTLSFELPASTTSSVWSAVVRVRTEAGRLESLAEGARRFFLKTGSPLS